MNDTYQPLAGQNVLVTGATGGIGAPLVECLARMGARVVIHYGRNQAAAEALLERIEGKGWIVHADLTEPSEAFALWERSIALAGRLHALVNNAGALCDVSVQADPAVWQEIWRKEFQVNVFSPADLCKEAISHFRANGGGRIVNLSSRAGQRGVDDGAISYAASKAAILNLTKSIARSFGADGVIAVAIAPGRVRTPMIDGLIAKSGEAESVADVPIGRMADPAAVAEAIAFALQPSQESLNGATLDINGGSYIR